MTVPQVRFLHTSDWQLETPIHGVVEIPPELREPFVDAPYLAAERVVQATIDHQVDFLVMSGNILAIEYASPYSFEFLLRQFQRLGEHGVTIYWLGGQLDDLDLWPAQLDLPEHVKLFPVASLQQFAHQRDGRVIAQLLGQSQRKGAAWRASDYAGGGDEVPRIAVGCGTVQKQSLENKGVDYWALGGEDRHQILLHGKQTAVYSGSPQGRQPRDTDAHGAVLVELQFGQAKTRLIETDLYRWRKERVVATDIESVESLPALINRSLSQISADATRHQWLLVWSVVAQGQLAQSLSTHEVADRLLRVLNQTSAQGHRWSLALDVDPVPPPTELLDEDTILGDFLRSVQRLEQTPDAWHDLVPYLPESVARDTLIAELQSCSDPDRQQLWRRVAAWGTDLLRGEVAVESSSSSR